MAQTKMKDLLEELQGRQASMLRDLEQLVRLESPSRHLESINAAQNLLQEWFDPLGAITRRKEELGDLLHIRVAGAGRDRLLLLAHVDTVYPVGSWRTAWRIEGDKAFGPGVCDMKGGIVQAAWALKALQALGLKPAFTIDLLVTADEEIGSGDSRQHIEALADGAQGVLVLEAPNMDGNLKVARKGVADYTIHISGRSAHQGTEPEMGRNAIVSTAQLIRELMKLEDLERGTTVGPNVIQGGTVSNVVPDQAVLKVDVRVWDLAEAERIDSGIRAISPLDGTRYQISGGLNRPPMEESEGGRKLLQRAQRLAGEIGLIVEGARVGGGSDGNFTANLAPTLDGLGALGAHAHQRNLEFIHIPSLVDRTTLLAGMLLED